MINFHNTSKYLTMKFIVGIIIFIVLVTINCNVTIIGTEIMANKSISTEIYDINQGCKNLTLLRDKIFSTETDSLDVIGFTNQYISELQEYLQYDFSLGDNAVDIGIRVIPVSGKDNQVKFNLVVYDGTPIGFGTLERTWVYLQVVNGDKISLFPLYECDAVVPLKMKVLNISDNRYILTVSGVTNVVRKSTAFLSFWEYDLNELAEFNNVIIEEDVSFGRLVENGYFIDDFLNEDRIKIEDNDGENMFFNIIGSNFIVNSFFQDETVKIQYQMEDAI